MTQRPHDDGTVSLPMSAHAASVWIVAILAFVTLAMCVLGPGITVTTSDGVDHRVEVLANQSAAALGYRLLRLEAAAQGRSCIGPEDDPICLAAPTEPSR